MPWQWFILVLLGLFVLDNISKDICKSFGPNHKDSVTVERPGITVTKPKS